MTRRWPDSIYGHGNEPDPRFRLANERTFLAWIRTTIALLAAAAAVDAFELRIPGWLQTALGVLLAAAALLAAIQSWRGWAAAERALRHDRPLPSNDMNIVLAVALVVVAVVPGVVFVLWFR